MKLTWEIVTKSSEGIGFKSNCLIAKWNDATLIHAMCLGLTDIFPKKRSTRLIAANNTSDGNSYHIFKHRRTYAEPSRPPAVTSRYN